MALWAGVQLEVGTGFQLSASNAVCLQPQAMLPHALISRTNLIVYSVKAYKTQIYPTCFYQLCTELAESCACLQLKFVFGLRSWNICLISVFNFSSVLCSFFFLIPYILNNAQQAHYWYSFECCSIIFHRLSLVLKEVHTWIEKDKSCSISRHIVSTYLFSLELWLDGS